MAAPSASPPTTAPAAMGARHPYPRQRASAWSGMTTAASVITAADATAICFTVMITASVLLCRSVALATFGSVDLGQQSRQRDVTAVTAGASGQAAAAIISLSKRGGSLYPTANAFAFRAGVFLRAK